MPANMKKSGMSYKKGGSKKMYGGTMKKKKMYGGTMKKKMYGGSKKKMMKKGGMMKANKGLEKLAEANPELTYTKKMYGGMANPNKDEMMMYGGAMYKKMMKMAGGPMMNEEGMKVPGMMKAGGGLRKMPGGGYMRDMDLPKAQSGLFTKGLKGIAKKLGKGKITNPSTIDNVNVKKTLFQGVNKKGEQVFKLGTDGNVFTKKDNAMAPFLQNKAKILEILRGNNPTKNKVYKKGTLYGPK
tara:strand:+ start:7839 stop:8561 length:723 start_codon:yes stop_codon:yes gene_type:complete